MATLHAMDTQTFKRRSTLLSKFMEPAGDGNYFSIGGPPGNSLPVAAGLLGQPRGISNAHNRFEGDASPARGDLYQFGEAYLTQMPFFQGLYDLPATGASNPNYDLDLLATNAVKRYQQSVSQNPYYFRGFFGLTIPAGTHAFIFRMFANKSAAYPEGFLDRNTLKSFYAMTGTDDSNMVYTPGTERIPDNWYTRAADDPYDVPLVDQDLTKLFSENPELVAFSGNTGTVNSFTGLNLANLTGGLYNAETLLQGNNLACFLLQSVAVASPDIIRNTGVIADIAGAVAQINDAVTKAVVNLDCTKLSKYEYDDSQLSIYQGYTKLKKDGTY